MKIHDVEQKSDAWFALRVQFPLTSSEGQAIATAGKGLETLCTKKLSEKYSSGPIPKFSGADTERGNELEPQARSIYEMKIDVEVVEAGFVTNENVSPVAGASPDGMVGEDGLVEIKCHNDEKHFTKVTEFKKTGKFTIDSKYDWQMQMQMLITERNWCDMAIFNPNFKDSLVVMRVFKDEEKQMKLYKGLIEGERLLKEKEELMNK